MQAASNGLLVVTGGPGTGKTTTINAIIRYFEQQNEEILLAAADGKGGKANGRRRRGMRQKLFTVCWSFPVCRRIRQKKEFILKEMRRIH